MKKTDQTLPLTIGELETTLAEEISKRQKFELEYRLGKSKKVSDIIKAKVKIARIKTRITENKKQ